MSGEHVEPTILGYRLKSEQNIYINYLLPAIVSCLVYVTHFAADIVLSYQHFYEDNPVWGSLTLLFIYLPAIGCFVITISSWELWPKYEGCDISNIKWAILKTIEHLCFPIWSMWRFAERIFWSVEAIRSLDEEDKNSCLEKVTSPRTIELYFFLQAYLQAIPQILLQFHVLFGYFNSMSLTTVEVLIMSITMSITKVALITTLYQRFKSIKITGKQYPWLKAYKYPTDMTVNVRNSDMKELLFTKSMQESEPQNMTEDNVNEEDVPSTSRLANRRSSSDLYLRMSDPPEDDIIVQPQLNLDSPDFFPKRLLKIRGLPEDDAVGKFISFLWWFCFLIARMLSIATFAAFYSTEIIWILASHFILVVSLLLYDVRADEVRRAKAIFFIFIGYVYLFCLIEFKIKFKKPVFIYNGFFFLMYTEIFVTTLIWYCQLDLEMEFWWYDYIFYLILVTSLLSLVSMLFYMRVLKQKKVTVGTVLEQ